MEYKATAEGEGREAAIEYFEENYKENMKREEAIEMGLEALLHSTEGKLAKNAVEIGVVEKGKKFEILEEKETEKYFNKAKGE